MITLMIKTHNQTGLKYFCKTNREDYIKYLGSGKYWRNHLNAHGKDISTEVYAQFEEECEELVKAALKFSEDNDIVESNEWANMIPEDGLGGGSWMKGLTLEEISKNHEAIREKLSKPKTEEHKQNLSMSTTGRILSEEHKSSISKSMINRYKDEEFYLDFCETMNKVNKKEDKRKQAGQKIKEKWKDPEYLEKMKIRNEKSAFKETLTCPHCGKHGKKGPMSRWHFDNCRNKNED
jgi:hypothetical protein